MTTSIAAKIAQNMKIVNPMMKYTFRRLFLLSITACDSTRVSLVAVEDVVAADSGVSSSVCNAMKLLCLAVGLGAKSAVAVLLASVLVSDIVSLSLEIREAMLYFDLDDSGRCG